MEVRAMHRFDPSFQGPLHFVIFVGRAFLAAKASLVFVEKTFLARKEKYALVK